MKLLSWPVELRFIAVGYAAVFSVAAFLVLVIYLQEVERPAGMVSSHGIYAAGDALLYIFIASLFLIPTAFLVRFMAKSELLYTAYPQFLLSLRLSAPVCLALFVLAKNM